jgi:hypothetical protein
MASAIFRLCHIFERILNEVYLKKTLSLDLAASISEQHRAWTKQLPQMLRIDGLNTDEVEVVAMARHLGSSIITMAYYYSIILLTRPFLIYRICSRPNANNASRKISSSIASVAAYAEACIDSAIKGIEVAYGAVFIDAMVKRQPLIINSVFISALCLGMAYLGDYDRRGWPLDRSFDNAIEILRRLGPLNPQSNRYEQICRYLKDSVAQYTRQRDEGFLQSNREHIQNIFGDLQNSQDPGRRESSRECHQTASHFPSASSTNPSSQHIPGYYATAILPPESIDSSNVLERSTSTTSEELVLPEGWFENVAISANFFGDTSGNLPDNFSNEDGIPLFALTNEWDYDLPHEGVDLSYTSLLA